jgi:GT2 family glycosyltransferase
MKLSVVICTRNRPDDLAICLGSLAVQTRPADEILVVDASDDEHDARRTAAWLPAGVLPAVRILRAAPGLTRQRNLGVANARGDVLTFLDDDVVLERGYLAAIRDLFEVDPGLGGAEGVIRTAPLAGRRRLANAYRTFFRMNGIGRPRGVKRSGFLTYDPWPQSVQLVECLSGCNMSYRREVFHRFRFDEWYDGYALGEDCDFSYRVARAWRLVQTPHARLEHRMSPVARQRRPALVEMARVHHYYFVRKNLPPTPLTWLCWAWSELGELLALVKTGDPATIGGALRGYRRLLARPPAPRRPRPALTREAMP